MSRRPFTIPPTAVSRRGEPMTLDEIGSSFGVTRERVRQIEAKALAKLRKACEREGVRVEDVLESPDAWRLAPGNAVVQREGCSRRRAT